MTPVDQSAPSRPARVRRAGSDIEVIDNDLTVQGRRFGRDYLVHRRWRR